MKTRTIILLAVLAAGIAAAEPAPARVQDDAGAQDSKSRDPGGMLGTLEHGRYRCALPGDAAGAAWKAVPEADFRVVPSSSYTTEKGRGTYIMRGRVVTFTRGPKLGEQLKQVGRNTLQGVADDGSKGRLTCTRAGAAN